MSETEFDFFDGVDIDDIPDNPNELPNNTYKFRVTSAKFGKTQAGDKYGITFKYQIIEGAWSSFFPLTEWLRVPEKDMPKDEKKRFLSYLKQRFVAFGFAPEEIQNFKIKTVDECIGREFYGTTSAKKEKDRTNFRVVKFSPITDDSVAGIDMGDDDEDPDY